MPAPVRYPNGVTNVDAVDPMAQLPVLDPTKVYTYFNDFNTYTAGDWTVTETQAGATQAITAGHGGQLLLTNSAADNDVNQLQLLQETFRSAAGKKLWFKARWKVSNATETDVYIGLIITDTDIVGGVTDGIYFKKADDATSLVHVLEKDSTETATSSVATIVADTFIETAFYYNGKNEVEVWIDGVKKATHTTLTNLCQDEDLAVTISLTNGSAVAHTLTIDYILAIQER